jgi:hypothetical protein
MARERECAWVGGEGHVDRSEANGFIEAGEDTPCCLG